MAGDLPSVRPAEVIRALERAGFVQIRQRGSHVFLLDRERGRRTVVAVHSREMRQTTLHAILRQAGLTASEFIDLLGR